MHVAGNCAPRYLGRNGASGRYRSHHVVNIKWFTDCSESNQNELMNVALYVNHTT